MQLLVILSAVAVLCSLAYLLAAVHCVRRFARRRDPRPAGRPPVSVLKPLCGLETGSYENLRSFCCQDYPAYQVVFGVRDADDPVIPLVERLIAELPDRDLALVVDQRVIGPNLKVSNLANIYPLAKHDLLVVADSDMHVGPDYLDAVVAGFEGRRVGAVTCLYRARPAGGLWSRLACLSINEWFLPSALVGAALAPLQHCFGATMAVRREVLEQIGGFARLAHYLADDFYLGHFAAAHGHEVRLSRYLVENVVREPSLRALFLHELRWSRTVRSVKPAGFAFSFLIYPVALALLASLVCVLTPGAEPVCATLVGLSLVLRVALHYVVRNALGIPGFGTPWLIPVRDLLGFAVWAAGLFGQDVVWKGHSFSVDGSGHLVEPKENPHAVVSKP